MTSPATPAQISDETSFAVGRYRVIRKLGEGGSKRVHLAHDTLIDREVAIGVIKTEGLAPSACAYIPLPHRE